MRVQAFKDTAELHYQYIAEKDIHEVIFAHNTRSAFEDFMGFYQDLLRELRDIPVPIIRILMNMETGGLPPINSVLTELRELYRDFPGRPRSRVAVIVKIKDKSLTTLIDSLARSAHSQGLIQFYLPAQQDEAIGWLAEL